MGFIDCIIETLMSVLFILFVVFVCAVILVSGAAFLVGWTYKWWISLIGFVVFVIFVAVLRWLGEINQWW